MFKRFLMLCATASLALSQTRLDLRSQGKTVDFTTANFTRPVKSGVTLPATCQLADLFFQTSAQPGSNLFGCVAPNTWILQSTGSSGTGSSGTSAPMGVVLSTTNTLTVGSTCSTPTPCNIRFGNTVYSFQAGATITLSAGSGVAYIYISAAGTVTVGHNMTLSCSAGCTQQSGVAAFPADSIPLYIWSATNGVWDATGGVDFRSILSGKNTVVGLGLISAESFGTTSITIDPTLVGLRVASPSSASSACSTGNWAFDGSFFYVCVGASTWKRTGVSSW